MFIYKTYKPLKIMNKKTIMKSLAIAIALIAGTAQVNAQKNDSSMFGVANRIGIGVGAGTEGIGIDLSTPLTKYVQARIGVNIMPDIKINTTATATIAELDRSEKIDIKGGIGRTTFDLKFDCYPFQMQYHSLSQQVSPLEVTNS